MQISKGPNVVFAIGADIRRAIDYGLRLAEAPGLRQVPGAVMGYFVDGHPFLDGNGRTLMLVFGELCFRHGFSIAWERTRCMRCFETVRCLSEV
ncbi:MAG: Fic family protein [Gemmobacter sp.]|nr:Fic family protein [Gemmobacter sp.]